MPDKKSSDKTVSVVLKDLKKKIVNNTIGIAPDWLLQSIIVGNADLRDEVLPGLTFSIARSKQDLEAAFHLLYKAYLSAGLMKKNKAQLRVTPYHALPTTTTLVGKIDTQVVCTVSIIKSNEFGVPIESVIDLSNIKKESMDEVGEVSALAVHSDYRGSVNKILFPMFKYLFEYSRYYMHLDYFVIGVHPSWFPFYKSIFGFEPLHQNKVSNYQFVEGAPMQAGYLNLKNAKYFLAKHHLGKEKSKNLFRYFIEERLSIFEFPDRRVSKSFDNVMTPELFKYFFMEKTSEIANLSGKQLLILSNIFRCKSFQEILNPYLKEFGITCNLLHRQHYRTKVKFKARIFLEDEKYVDCEVVDASQGGIGIFSKKTLTEGKTYSLKVKLDEFEIIELKATCKVDRKNNIYGFELANKNEIWVNQILKITEGMDHTQINKAKPQFRLIKNEDITETFVDSDLPPLIFLDLDDNDEGSNAA